MKKKGLPKEYISNTSAFIEHPSEMIPIKDGFFTYLDIHRIKIPMEQVRKHFDEQGMDELIQSIKANGLIHPVVVREENKSIYLVSGERRLRACINLDFEQIPAIFTDKNPDIISLIENLQREDLTPFEEASAYHNLKMKFRVTLSDLSRIVGKDYKYVSRIMKLVELPDSIKNEFVTSRISKELLIRISQINDKQEQLRIWNILKTGEFTVKEAKKILRTRRVKPDRRFSIPKLHKYINTIYDEIEKIPDHEPISDINEVEQIILTLEKALSKLKGSISRKGEEIKSDIEINNSDYGVN